MTYNEFLLLSYTQRLSRLENNGKNFQSQGVVKKLKRKIRKLSNEF